MASFGFSVGDFITCLSLVREITQALRDSTGSVADYKSFLQTLNSLNLTFTTSELIYLQCQNDVGDPKHSSNAQAMVNVMAFLKRRERAVVRGWRKITWLYQKEEIGKLERDLQGHMRAMQIYADALFQNQMTHHKHTVDSQFQRLFSSVVDMRTDLSAISKSIHTSASRFPQSLGYPWEASSSLAENVLLLDANGRSLLLPMLFLSSPKQFHELLTIMYRGIPGHKRILRKEYTLTNEDSDGIMVQESNWDNVIRAGIQLSLNIILQASSSWKKRHCPRCDEPTLCHTLPGKRRRCHKCQLTYRVFEHERVVEGNTVIPASETLNSTSPEDSASEIPELGPRHGTKRKERKDELFVREEFYFKHIHYHREIQVIKTSSIQPPIVEDEPQQLKVEDLPPLHRAAANGSLAEIGALLDSGEMVNSRLPFNAMLDKPLGGRQEFRGCSPLHLAAYFGRAKAIELLLDRGADISAKDWFGSQPLHFTLTGENYAVAILLLAQGADANATNKEGDSFLHRVCEKGIAWLLSPILEYGGDLTFKESTGSNALHLAAYHGREELVETLLEKDIATCITALDNGGETPLHDAAWNGSAKITAALLEHGASSSLPGATGTTPLHHASYRGNYEVVKLLLEHRCPADIRDKDGHTPLHNACINGGSERIVRLLLKSGADPTTRNEDGWTPLHVASLNSNYEVARLLLERGCSVSTQDKDGYTPLHDACWSDGTERIVRLLLESGADPAAKNEIGCTPLHIASLNSNCDAARLLFEHGCTAAVQDNDGETPLHYACWSDGTESFVRSLLEHGADIRLQRANGATPLHIASRSGNISIMKVLLEAGAEKLLEIEDNDRLAPLLCACWSNTWSDNTEAIKLLLSHGADVKIQDEDGETPLHFMAMAGNSELSMIMLENGADVDAKTNDGDTPLCYASRYNHVEVVEILLKRWAGVNTQNKEGNTPLYIASCHGHEVVAKVLLKHGAGVNTQNKEGNTPLQVASYQGHEVMAKVLLEHGAGVNIQSKRGITPLHVASYHGHEVMAKVLLEHGAGLNIQDEGGNTPLHVASYQGREAMVKVLLENGAKVMATDHSGKTPLHLAAREGHPEVVKHLLEYEGIDTNIRNSRGQTPFREACINGHESVAKLLIHAADDIDTFGTTEWTQWPLQHDAADQNYETIAQRLLTNDADTTLIMLQGYTALHYAVAKCHFGVVQILAKAGADLNAQDEDGRTALYWACGNHSDLRLKTIEYLLDNGSDPFIKTKWGSTPLDLAESQKMSEIAALLRKRMGDNTEAQSA